MKFEERKLPQSAAQALLPEIVVEQLPSRFKAYPEGCTIKYVPYTYGETIQFIQSKYTVKERLNFVLKGIRASFNKMDLCLDDVFYIDILRKLSTFGAGEYTIPYTCEKCGNASTATLVMDVDLKKNASVLDFNESKCEEFPNLTLTNGRELEFSHLTIGKFIELLDSGLQDEPLGYIAAQCTTFKKTKDAYKEFFNITYDDGVELQQVGEALKIGIKPIQAACVARDKESNECGHVNEVEVNGLTLIGPFRTSNGAAGSSRIHFGKRTRDIPS